MHMAHNAEMNVTGDRGRNVRATAPRARRRPPPNLPPLGGGTRFPPPVGEGAVRHETVAYRIALLKPWLRTGNPDLPIALHLAVGRSGAMRIISL